MPENYNTPGSKTINLAYVIIKSKKPSNLEYPLIYLTGGPGGKTLTRRTIDRFRNSAYRKNRDIILFDQRDIGFSSALLNMNNEIFELMSKGFTPVEESTEMSKLLVSMKHKIESNGDSIVNYNTFRNAKNVGLIMKKLGYKKYNILET